MTKRTLHKMFAAIVAALLLQGYAAAQNRITILTDAFGRWPKLTLDWGYAALVEYNGKRILFDTGDNIAVLKENVAKLNVDLTHLDMVVISHAHADHTAGLRWILELNPKVQLFVPDDVTFRGRELPQEVLSMDKVPVLPKEQRYFNGFADAHIPEWQAYSDVDLRVVKGQMSVAPGVRLVSVLSKRPPDRGLLEVAMVLDTPKGPVVIVGCSHPGIEEMLDVVTANRENSQVSMLFGGLHLMEDTEPQIDHTLALLQQKYGVQRIAAGHCTGERAFYRIHERWKKYDVYAGLGETVTF